MNEDLVKKLKQWSEYKSQEREARDCICSKEDWIKAHDPEPALKDTRFFLFQGKYLLPLFGIFLVLVGLIFVIVGSFVKSDWLLLISFLGIFVGLGMIITKWTGFRALIVDIKTSVANKKWNETEYSTLKADWSVKSIERERAYAEDQKAWKDKLATINKKLSEIDMDYPEEYFDYTEIVILILEKGRADSVDEALYIALKEGIGYDSYKSKKGELSN